MAKKLKMGMLVCASLLAVNAVQAENSAMQESLSIVQQTQKIKGTIVDSKTGEPVIGASVKVKGTKLAAVTDVDGNLKLILLRVQFSKCRMLVTRMRSFRHATT